MGEGHIDALHYSLYGNEDAVYGSILPRIVASYALPLGALASIQIYNERPARRKSTSLAPGLMVSASAGGMKQKNPDRAPHPGDYSSSIGGLSKALLYEVTYRPISLRPVGAPEPI
jgi:hypothetical protein